ncbi:MAG: hypothetical protein U9Q03_02490 [Patescibacteria group bacterium]|nr:hypothetical protein [Patescibacteria group bacterium]
MTDVDTALKMIAETESAYEISPPDDWVSAVRYMRWLGNYDESVIHEAAHAVAAWHSPTCLTVFWVRVGEICETMVFSPPNRRSCVLWDTMAFYLAGAAVVAAAKPGFKPTGTQLDISTAINNAIRLTADRNESVPAHPWTDYTEIPTPDIRKLLPLIVAERQLPLMRIAWRRALAVVATRLHRTHKLCEALQRSGKLNTLDLIRILGRRPIFTPLAATAFYFAGK